jgi:hypothetical protein
VPEMLHVTYVRHGVALACHALGGIISIKEFCSHVLNITLPLIHDVLMTCSQQMTSALWAGIAPAALLGAGCSWWRTRYFSVTVVAKFRWACLPAGGQLHSCLST